MFSEKLLAVDRIQSDLFAPPSMAHVVVPASTAQFPAEFYRTPARRVALADYLSRSFHRVVSTGGHDQRQVFTFKMTFYT